MHTDLVRVHSNVELPEFPPKKWFGHRSAKFVCRRMNMLNEYFRKLMLIEEVRASECLLKAIQPCKSLDLLVIGQAKIGKAKFTKRFLHYKPAGIEVTGEFSPFVNHITTRSVSSAMANDSTVFSEIEQFTPVDVIVDDWLVRVNSIQIRNVSGDLLADDIQKVDLMAAQKDGAIVTFDSRSEESQRVAQRLLSHFRRRAVCTLIGLGGRSTDLGSDVSEPGEFAYRSFTDFIRKLVSE